MHKHFVSLLSHASLSWPWIFHGGGISHRLSSPTYYQWDSVEAGTPQSYHLPDWSLMWPRCKLFKDLDVDIWKADFLIFPAFNLKHKVLPVLPFQVNFYTERLIYMLIFKRYTGRLQPSRTIFGHTVHTIQSLCLSLVSLSMPSQALPDTQHFSYCVQLWLQCPI